MESEKVKEIKKALECISELCKDNRTYTCYSCVISQNFTEKSACKEALTLINELESENERLSKELDSEWKDRRKAEEDLHKAQWNYKIGLGQSRKRNKELKDRIAELEEYIKGNEQDAKAFVNGWRKDLETELKQFAERLKDSGEIKALLEMETMPKVFKHIHNEIVKSIDETLKECLCDNNQ